MISTTAYILISTLSSRVQGDYYTVSQSTSTFADKTSCESAAARQDFVMKSLEIHGRWNLTCHPYQLSEVKHEPSK
jgi:hypothetical protein